MLLCAAYLTGQTHAQTLSDADREALLGNLEKLRETTLSRLDGKYRVALAAFRNAMSSDDQAIELYLNCYEKVNYDEQQKKTQDFREWKRKEADKLTDPAFRKALRVQLSWLILALQASADKPDQAKIRNEAEEILDSVFHDPEKIRGQERMLSESVNNSVFARAYEVNLLKPENFPLSPVNLDEIYGKLLLPPLRNPEHLAALRTTWVKRIQQDIAKRQYLETVRGGPERGGDSKRPGPAPAAEARSPELEKFMTDTVPKLQWEMEVDLYNCGDERGAALRMLAHIEKYITHPSAKEWGEQFGTLLRPKAPVVTPPTAAAP
ncbi:MAG: hypothetical protein ABIT37_06855 [Luteolibacter sp.]